jgi:hypothetical protein
MANFGIITVVRATQSGTAWALINGIKLLDKVNIAVSKDASGDVDAYQTSGREREARIDLTYDIAEVGVILPGDILFIGGEKYLVESITDTESNLDYKRSEVVAYRWPNNRSPA